MRLLQILKERGISKYKLAMSVKINPSTLYDEINGKIKWYPNHKKKIAEFLLVDEQYLFGSDCKYCSNELPFIKSVETYHYEDGCYNKMTDVPAGIYKHIGYIQDYPHLRYCPMCGKKL